MAARIVLIAALALPALTDASVVATLEGITSSFGLNEQYQFKFPSSSLQSSKADDFIISQWDVNDHGIQFGTSNIDFVSDPASGNSKRAAADAESTSSSKKGKQSSTAADAATSVVTPTSSARSAGATGGAATGSTVLRITYPEGSYSQATGGTQFTAQPLNASSKSTSPFSNVTSSGKFERMLLSYDVFFPQGYQFNQGGKLPGLRGGPDPVGCSGGHQSDGMKCFSARLMWRSGQIGEVYSYLPPGGKNFCKRDWITCNKDYGTSMGRGTFSFLTGKWQTVWLYVELNEVGWRNGMISLWYDGVQAVKVDQLELRKTDEIDSVAGFFFSTFFGGYDASWATPTTQYSYFRNIQLFGGMGASNSTGPRSAATTAVTSPTIGLLALLVGGVVTAVAFV